MLRSLKMLSEWLQRDDATLTEVDVRKDSALLKLQLVKNKWVFFFSVSSWVTANALEHQDTKALAMPTNVHQNLHTPLKL